MKDIASTSAEEKEITLIYEDVSADEWKKSLI